MLREYFGMVRSYDPANQQEQFRRREIPTKGRLTYVKSKSRLLVELQTKKTDEWIKCFETSIVLPESPYLGFSAMTGDVSDNHE
jgi:mannose-binding lectin 2